MELILTAGLIVLVVLILSIVAIKQIIKDEYLMTNKERGEAIGNIVQAVEKHSIKKEKQITPDKQEETNIAARRSIENIAKSMREANSQLTPEELENFWMWVDSEVAKMTDQQRAELEKLINK